MSLLGRYLDWFRDRNLAGQVGSSVALFVVLFVLGLYTAGVAPGVILVVLLIDHWYRG